MNCEKARELFSERFEENLSPALREAFDRHIRACPACEHDYRAFRALWPLLADGGEVPAPPPDLAEKIARRLDHTDWQRDRMVTPWTRRLAPVLVAAGVIAAILLWQPIADKFGSSSLPAGIVLNRSNPTFGTTFNPATNHLIFFGVEGTKYRLLAGGSDSVPYPPADARLIEEGTFATSDANSRTLNYVPEGGRLWIDLAIHEDVLVVILPKTALGARDEAKAAPTGSVLTALEAYATRYGVPVIARLPRTRQIRIEGFDFGGNPNIDARKIARRAGLTVGYANGCVVFWP